MVTEKVSLVTWLKNLGDGAAQALFAAAFLISSHRDQKRSVNLCGSVAAGVILLHGEGPTILRREQELSAWITDHSLPEPSTEEVRAVALRLHALLTLRAVIQTVEGENFPQALREGLAEADLHCLAHAGPVLQVRRQDWLKALGVMGLSPERIPREAWWGFVRAQELLESEQFEAFTASTTRALDAIAAAHRSLPVEEPVPADRSLN